MRRAASRTLDGGGAPGPRLHVKEIVHGTRATYQRLHCPCAACLAANAAYSHAWRVDHRRGRVRLGAIISPLEARALLKALKIERVSAHYVAVQLGLVYKTPRLRGTGITVRRSLKIRLIRRRLLPPDPARRAAAFKRPRDRAD
jgi:hypothetical protein